MEIGMITGTSPEGSLRVTEEVSLGEVGPLEKSMIKAPQPKDPKYQERLRQGQR